MQNYLNLNKTDFINNVVVPYHLGANKNNFHYMIYDEEGKIIHASLTVVKLLDYSDISQIQGHTLSHIYKYIEKCPNVCNQLENIRQNVITAHSPVDFLCVAEVMTGMQAYIMQHSPIFYSNGEVVGSIVTFKETNQELPHIPHRLFSQKQEEIIFLLSVGGSQKEVASILKVTRGTIAKTLETIGIRMNASGASKRNTVTKAAEIGCGKLPMEHIKPGVVPLSKLYNNSNILSLFSHF